MNRLFDDSWVLLQQELDRWVELGYSASFWWRDDDAISNTDRLGRLDSLSQELNIPVSLAVIPARFDESLTRYLLARDHFTVLQHGFAHKSHARKGVKKIEIGGERETREICDELIFGRQKLDHIFGAQFLPVLVPPWNRIEPRVSDALADIGFKGLSSMWARKNTQTVDGLLQVNTHLDPINWHHGRSFIGEHLAVGQIHQHLYARRTGYRDRAEPTGILTHHLDQNERVWTYCRQLMQALSQHRAVSWLAATDIWTLG